jgi:hypothetical protein
MIRCLKKVSGETQLLAYIDYAITYWLHLSNSSLTYFAFFFESSGLASKVDVQNAFSAYNIWVSTKLLPANRHVVADDGDSGERKLVFEQEMALMS